MRVTSHESGQFRIGDKQRTDIAQMSTKWVKIGQNGSDLESHEVIHESGQLETGDERWTDVAEKRIQ